MFHLHHSNRLERLFERLERSIREPLSDPLAPEVVVVQNQGLARWIAQQLAQATGIAANLAFPLPASFFRQVLEAWIPDLPQAATLDRETLLWRLMAELPRHLGEPAFAEPARYLAGEPRDLKRFQLCSRIADLFDQYLVYRPDWILAWEQGEGDHWQAGLWRALAADVAGLHRAAVLARFREAIAAGRAPAGDLPERVSLFGLTALAPAYLEMLAALAGYTDVHLFLLDPCREYWADLVPERAKARRRARAFRTGEADTSALLDVGNPLLASMGHAGQEFLDLLLELDPDDQDDFADPGDDCLLHRLQGDILDLRDQRTWDPKGRAPIGPDDDSIQVQVCHSRLREVQVLHDRLLRMFEELPGLAPRDLVVMAPDIDQYAPYVDAVFGAVDDRHLIPWAISDRRLEAEQPVLAAFNDLLRLPGSRAEASATMALLEVPAVQRRFGLDAAGLERLRTWVRESGIRWGLDGAMREGLGLPAEEANTWDFGLCRLFLGYALPPDQTLYGDAAPYPDVEGGDSVYLGVLQEFVGRLAAWRAELGRRLPACAWQIRINALLADFFDPDPEEGQELQRVRDALDRLCEQAAAAGLDEPLSMEVVGAWLDAVLAQAGGPYRFLTGRVTFCNLVPMRSVPFRVVCLLGMNDTDFPRNQRPLGFDLIARHPRRGDRSRRRDDRYLFLEALLSARDRLYLSYVGQDVRDNSIKVPSVPATELLDYISRAFRLMGDGNLLDRIMVRHPLQPFSPRYFDPAEPRLYSFADDWLAAARVAAGSEVPPFADRVLEEPDAEWREVELDELIRFFANPAAFFLTNRLGLRLLGEADALEDVEAFELAGLERYGLRQTILGQALAGADPSAVLPILRGEGRLPHGVMGDLIFREHAVATAAFVERVRPRLGGPEGEPMELDLPIGAYRLRGWLPAPARGGLADYRLGRLRAKDRLGAWIRHLASCALAAGSAHASTHVAEDGKKGRGTRAEEVGTARASVHVAEDKTLFLEPVANARALLEDLLDARWQGLREPLAFFPETSLTWAEQAGFTDKVWNAWAGDYNAFAESLDPAVAIAWRGRDPFESNAFADLAARVYAPMLAAATLIPAAKDHP